MDTADLHRHGHGPGEHGHAHPHTETKAVLNRLAKISGHLRFVRNMVEDGRDCSEVLVQLAAVRSAVDGVSRVILQDHITHCIVDAAKCGDQEKIEQLNHAIAQLLK